MVKKAENIIVGISIGDLNGIGSEVILKTFEDTRMLELCTPVIFANVKIISFLKRELNYFNFLLNKYDVYGLKETFNVVYYYK